MWVVDLALEVFGGWLVGVVWCCAFGLCLLHSFVVFVVGLVWLLCVACGFGLLLLSVFGWVCFNLMVFILVFSCCV